MSVRGCGETCPAARCRRATKRSDEGERFRIASAASLPPRARTAQARDSGAPKHRIGAVRRNSWRGRRSPANRCGLCGKRLHRATGDLPARFQALPKRCLRRQTPRRFRGSAACDRGPGAKRSSTVQPRRAARAGGRKAGHSPHLRGGPRGAHRRHPRTRRHRCRGRSAMTRPIPMLGDLASIS